VIVVVTGVSGAGKSRVGALLARRLGWPFHDADDFHSPEARARMARGEALDDGLRAPWLDRLAALMAEAAAAERSIVLACSALRTAYRDRLRAAAGGRAPVRFVFLRVDPATAARRSAARRGHFAGPALVPGQFAALEEPGAHDAGDTLVLDATEPPEHLVERIAAAL
jgi:gluconokinase